MRRKAYGSEFRSNFHLGGSIEKIDITDEQERIACLAAKTMGLDLAGVDMLLSGRGPLILEVNSSPGLEGIETSTGINIASKIIEYLNIRYKEKMDLINNSKVSEVSDKSDDVTNAY